MIGVGRMSRGLACHAESSLACRPIAATSATALGPERLHVMSRDHCGDLNLLERRLTAWSCSMKIALALIPVALAALEEHRVDSLPGFDGPLPSTPYSGYLPVGNTSGSPGFIHCA